MTANVKSEMRLPWVPVLLYHRVVPAPPERDPFGNCITTGAFESHLRWLAWRGYRSLTVSDLALAAVHGRGQSGLRVAITFDDGYQDNWTHALPLLQRYGFNATVFVVTDAIGGYNDFDAGLGVERAPMLTSDEILALAGSGIEIGSHTCAHPPSLPQLSDAEMKAELARSRDRLEAIVGRPVRCFSYPHSRVTPRAQEAVMEAGYLAACAGVGTRFSRYNLSRVATSPVWGPALGATMAWRRLKHAVARRRPSMVGAQGPE